MDKQSTCHEPSTCVSFRKTASGKRLREMVLDRAVILSHVAAGELTNLVKTSGKLDGPKRFQFPSTGPGTQTGKLLSQRVREHLDSAPLGGVVAGQDEGDALGLGGEAIVKAHLAGQKYVGLTLDCVRKEFPGRATGQRDGAHQPTRLADCLNRAGP